MQTIKTDTPLGSDMDKRLSQAVKEGNQHAVFYYNILHIKGLTADQILKVKNEVLFPNGVYWNSKRD